MTNEDLISRAAAIDAIQGIGRLATTTDNDAVIRMSAVEYVLFNLPSAQQEETCDTCKYGYFGDDMCDYCRVGFPSNYERRTDE